MRHSGAVAQTAVEEFLTYVNRRRVLMVIGGVAAIGAGVAGLVTFGGGGSSVWFGGLALLGLLVALGATAGASMVNDVETIAAGPSAKMELTTWPYRTGRSPVNNRVRVTLDAPGSVQRTPVAEFKAVWYTPGTADRPTRLADVFGNLDIGQTVLAVAEDRSCYLGRVSGPH